MAQRAKRIAEENSHHDCDFRDMLSRVGDKWSLLVIFILKGRPAFRGRFSDLKRSIPGISQRMLTATVRNHAGYDVGFPAIDLVLTNSRDHTLARRIFQPRDYLEPGRDARAGIPGNAEVTINLDLDTGDLNPSGFRLDLLAAQQP